MKNLNCPEAQPENRRDLMDREVSVVYKGRETGFLKELVLEE